MQAINDTSSQVALAMELNNHGVELLQTKRYGEAVAVFSKVLGGVKTLLSQGDGCTLSADILASPFCKFLNSKSQQPIADSGFFLFQSPLIVNCEFDSKASFNDLVRLSTVSLYNLALGYHLGALDAKNPCKLYRRALAFYQLAHNIEIPKVEMELGIVLTMAIVNNIGHIHHVFANDDKAIHCFQHLLQTIMYVTNCGQGNAVPHLEGFLQNVQISILKPVSAPSA